MHPRGHVDTVDDDWKNEVREAMAALGLDQKKLAEKISISEGAISGMFSPGLKQIRYKARIHEALGWPDSTRSDGAVRLIVRAVPKLDAGDQDIVVALVESFLKKKKLAAGR